MKKLPTDNESLENACILTSDNSNATWCLICDPCAKIIDWIEGYFSPVGNKESSDALHEEDHKSHLVQVQYSVCYLYLDCVLGILYIYATNN